MQYKKWLLTVTLTAIAAVTTSVPALSQQNRSDITGHQTYSAPSVPVGSSSGSGGSIGKINYNPGDGTVTGEGLENPIEIGESSGNSRAVTLNDLAELLGGDLNQSLEQLAAAENDTKVASGPRRIGRRIARRATKDCINPAFQARETVESKLEQSKKFIEQVNQIQPEKAMW
jgi:hypothetical protein